MKKFRTILAAFLLLFITTPVLGNPAWTIGMMTNTRCSPSALCAIIDGKDYYFALDEGLKCFPVTHCPSG